MSGMPAMAGKPYTSILAAYGKPACHSRRADTAPAETRNQKPETRNQKPETRKILGAF
ncbi:MAG: hypothetical protein LBD48_13160 [Treponema sp.]|nr:hypothetical protein [Treponema sp.]